MVDALPYYDQGYDEPGVREAAIALVEEETRRYRPTKRKRIRVRDRKIKRVGRTNKQPNKKRLEPRHMSHQVSI